MTQAEPAHWPVCVGVVFVRRGLSHGLPLRVTQHMPAMCLAYWKKIYQAAFATCCTYCLPCTCVVLQDMPGWGDEIDLVSNLKTVVQFLLEQRKKDLMDNKAGVTGDRAAAHVRV